MRRMLKASQWEYILMISEYSLDFRQFLISVIPYMPEI